MERSYLEIKVTLMHVLIMLAGVIVIGIFLFYLGYQAGKSSMQNQAYQAELKDNRGSGSSREINIIDNKETGDSGSGEEDVNGSTPASGDVPVPSIDEEIKMHQQPKTDTEESNPPTTPSSVEDKNEPVKEKTVTRETYYSIQVGAFSSFSNARTYASKFDKLGYPTEILSQTGKKGTLFRVRVGRWPGLAEAKKGKEKLEKMEKKKFSIKKVE